MRIYITVVAIFNFYSNYAFGGIVPSNDGLIVGGVEAEKGEFPFIVGLRKPNHYCGGSIVNSEWIITAAHCSLGEMSSYTIVAGDHRNNQNDGTEQNRTVVRIISHPNYNAGTIENDISLMKVSPPFQFNRFVRPLNLAPGGFIPSQRQMVIGWGKLVEGGSASNVLMKVQVPYVTDEDCKVAYGTRIKDSMMCAGEEGKDACQGDSGGPLLCSTRQGKKLLCGLVSWGTGCARPDKPGVYTEVSHFDDWISATLLS